MIGKISILALVGLAFATAGCATDDVEPAKTSYSLGRGLASYDQLRRDSEKCAAERRAPRNGYFELEAQPPMMMP